MFYFGQQRLDIEFSTRATHQDNEFDQTFTTHQYSNGKTFPPHKLAGSCREGTSDDLSRKCNGNDSDNVCPCNAIIQQTKIGAQARQCEIQRKKQDGNKVFDLLSQSNCETTLVGTDESNKKC